MDGPRHLDFMLEFMRMNASLENEGRGICSFTLRYGRSWTPAPFSCPVPFKAVKKQCHANAQTLLMTLEHMEPARYTYVEGYACSGSLSFPFPIHHAWLVTEDETVIDPTWDNPENSTYFGVPFATDYVNETISETLRIGSLIDNFHNRWALLRNSENYNFLHSRYHDEYVHSGHAGLRPT